MGPNSAANVETAANTYSTPCPTGTLVAWGDGHAALAPAWCKRWRCDNCGWKKAKALAKRIMAANPSRFVTFTVRPTPGMSAQDELDRMNAAWRNIWKRIRRLYGERARGYVRVVELTKKGTPHLHIALACPYLPQSTLSRWWHEFTSSSVVDIRAVRSEKGLSRYLAKYLTKESGAVDGRRKWSQTKGFLPPAEAPQDEEGVIRPVWIWAPAKIELFAASLALSGWVETQGLWLDVRGLPPD